MFYATHLTDHRAATLRAAGWIIKTPRFISGQAVYPLIKREG